MSNYHGFKPEERIYLISEAVDFRMSINGLTAYAQEILQISPSCGACFLFCNKAKDKIKIVHWDYNGFWLHYKRLENGRFVWPDQKIELYEITRQQYDWLMNGLSIDQRDGFDEILQSKVV